MTSNKIVFFLAPTYSQAAYWAREWGFKPSEWKYVSHHTGGRGYRQEGIVVYLCGTWYTSDAVAEILRYFNAVGIECIMAEDVSDRT